MTDVELPTAVTQDRFTIRGFPIAHAGMIVFLTVLFALADEDLELRIAVPIAIATCAMAFVALRLDWSQDDLATVLRRFGVWSALVGLWIPLLMLETSYLQAMFTLFPLTYAMLPLPWSIAAALVPPAAWGVAEIVNDGSVFEWLVLPLAIWALSSLFSIWVARIIDQSEERAQLLAELAATRAELAEAEHRAGARAERERMAREIHDTLAQGFTSIVLHSRGALARLDRGDPATETLELVERVASEHLAEARRLVQADPAEQVGGSLLEAVERVAAADEPRAVVRSDGELTGFGGTVDVAVLRVVQEAVANARKHAHAERIDVSLSRAGSEVLVDVVDDGCGFDPATGPSSVAGTTGGTGLGGLRRRIEDLGGRVVIESEPGGGTSLSVALPVGSR